MPPPDDDLADRLARAQQAIRARDDFLAIAAHELRSPLNALALRLQALERKAAQLGVPSIQLDIERTRRSVDRYVRRAVVLLDVTRLQSGQAAPVLEPVRLEEVVPEVVEAYRDEAGFHGADLQWTVEQPATGHWDPHMVEEILANLVNNAIKYGAGSPVRVRAGVVAPGMACLEVRDGGPGIGEAERARIFERFERLVCTSRNRAGFGLGLWIVGRMVGALQGSIEVTAPQGGGTCFRVMLPMHPPPQDKKDDET